MGFGKIFGKSSPEKQKKKEEAKALKQKQKEEKAAAKAAKKEQKKQQKILDNEIVAKVSMNVAMDTKSRSSLTKEELMSCNTGHSWIEVQMLDSVLDPETKAVRPDLAECMGSMAPKIVQEQDGNVSMGFYPETYWEIEDYKRDEKLEQHKERAESHFSPGRGYSYDKSKKQKKGTMALLMSPGPGIVEEPDDACGVAMGRKTFNVTRAQFKQIYAYVNAHRHHQYNFVTYNCTTFAAHALQAGGLSLSAQFLPGICMPTAFYKSIYKDAKKTDDEGASKGIELQALAEIQYKDRITGEIKTRYESHGKYSEDKKTGGKDVRIKGKSEEEMNRHEYLTHAQKRRLAEQEAAARREEEARLAGPQIQVAPQAKNGMQYVAARGNEVRLRMEKCKVLAQIFNEMKEGLADSGELFKQYAVNVDGWSELAADENLRFLIFIDYIRYMKAMNMFGGKPMLDFVKQVINNGLGSDVLPIDAADYLAANNLI